MTIFSNYPTPTAGLTLGVSGIVAFWAAIFPATSPIILSTGLCITLFLLAPLIYKFIRHPILLLEDLKDPTIGSVIPTLAMTLMLLSHTIGLILPLSGIITWCIAVTIHVIFLATFAYFRIKHFHLNQIVPSWFVPPIGIVVSCLTVPAAFLLPIAYIILEFGIVSYIILLPIVLYRLGLGDKIETARKPTLAILAAPASLTLAGYLTIIRSPNIIFVLILLGIALVMTLSVYLMLFHLLRLSFSPAYSAFTFPLAISATAMFKVSHWINTIALLKSYSSEMHIASLIEGAIATIIIAYVLIHTLYFLLSDQLKNIRIKNTTNCQDNRREGNGS